MSHITKQNKTGNKKRTARYSSVKDTGIRNADIYAQNDTSQSNTYAEGDITMFSYRMKMSNY